MPEVNKSSRNVGKVPLPTPQPNSNTQLNLNSQTPKKHQVTTEVFNNLPKKSQRSSSNASISSLGTRSGKLPPREESKVSSLHHDPKRTVFEIVRKMTGIICDENASVTDQNTVIFSRSKKALGGTDVGMIAKIDGEEHLVKTGISRSLLGQALTHCANGKIEDANKLLGYIVNDSIRLIDGSASRKSEIKQNLTATFHTFLETGLGKRLMGKAASDDLSITDVSEIHSNLILAKPSLKDPLGIPVLFDVINVAAAQDLVNTLQGSYLRKDQIPDSTLLSFSDNALIASRLVADSTPLDGFLMKSFLPSGCSISDARNAISLVKSAKGGKPVNADELTQATELISKINSPDNILSGKQALAEALNGSGLDGLFTSLLARLTLGESADLGPDNMLVVAGDDGRSKVISIDVTGFRYPRANDFQAKPEDPPRHGWSKVFADPSIALSVLLDGSVLSSRYARGFDPVHTAIVEAMREALHQQAVPEAEAVREWYASQDLSEAKASLQSLGESLINSIAPDLMPDTALVRQVLNKNLAFIEQAQQEAQRHTKLSPTGRSQA